MTAGLGVGWLVLTALTGLAFASDADFAGVAGDVDAVKGIVQRAAQLLFGAWLALLGLWFAARPGADA